MKINETVKTKNLKFKNRIIIPPMATAKADDNGHVTSEIINYYKEKTESGLFAAVIVEHNFVSEEGKAHKNQMSVSKDSDIVGLKKIAETIKSNGSLAILQISHAGSMAKKEVTGTESMAPSAIKTPTGRHNEIPMELDFEGIKRIKEKFIDAAERAKKAGFDGVEIHSAHGYLLDQFLSPLSNKRCDKYGTNIEGRIRLHVEIIEGIKARLGKEYPVLIRMGAGDFMEGGLTIDESIFAAKAFEKSGVDAIDISGGMCFYTIEESYPGYFDSVSKPIYENVEIPVILTGGIKHGRDVEDVLNRNVCDLIGIGRAVFQNSNWIINELGSVLK